MVYWIGLLKVGYTRRPNMIVRTLDNQEENILQI